MSAAHVGIIVNPSKTSREDIESALEPVMAEQPDTQVSWFETSVEDPGRGAAKDALDAGADLVIAAGGDGTVRAVAEYLAEGDTSAELGIIPLGTGNLLARNLGIPLNNIRKALDVALTGEARTIDLGWVETGTGETTERYGFTVMAGFGIDAHMITETAEDLKDKVGWLAYIESMGRAVSASDVIEMGLAVDDETSSQEQAHTLIVGNFGELQGGVTLLPDADPADGELDMLVLSADGVAGWLDTMRTMMWDNGLKRMVGGTDEAESSESVSHRRVTSVAIDLGDARVLEVDGDDVGDCTHVTFSIQPDAFRVRSSQS